MKKLTKKKKRIIHKILGIIFLIGCLYFIIYYSYFYGRITGSLKGAYKAGGIEWICNKTGGLLKNDGYCYLSETESKQYDHYFDCEWGKLSLNVNQRDYSIFEYMVFQYAKCKPVEIRMNYYDNGEFVK